MSFLDSLKEEVAHAQKKNFRKTILRHLAANPEMQLIAFADMLLSDDVSFLSNQFKVKDIFNVPKLKVNLDKKQKLVYAEEVRKLLLENPEIKTKGQLVAALKGKQEILDNLMPIINILRGMKQLTTEGRGKGLTLNVVTIAKKKA